MYFEPPPQDTTARTWNLLMAVLALFVAAAVAVQIGSIVTEGGSSDFTSILEGDQRVRIGLSDLFAGDLEQEAAAAVKLYDKARPSPGACRRMGLTKEAFLNQSGASDFKILASRAATKGLDKSQVARLAEESAMWREIYAPARLTRSRAEQFARRVARLDLGPLEMVAVSQIKARSGQSAEAEAALEEAQKRATHSLILFTAAIAVLGAAGLVGIPIAVLFFVRYGRSLAAGRRVGNHPSALLGAFIVYLLTFSILGAGLVAFAHTPTRAAPNPVAPVGLILQGCAMVVGILAGLLVLGSYSRQLKDTLAGIGMRLHSLRQLPIRSGVKWGVGGYCAVIPFLAVTLLISQYLSRTVFKDVPTPDHPLLPAINPENGLTFAVAFVLAAVVAPLVEETAFRGLLYTSLRARTGVVASVMISAAIFAAIHPTLPAQFLPIFALGCAFALLREKTGSLAPSMICHGINNAVGLLFVWLIS